MIARGLERGGSKKKDLLFNKYKVFILQDEKGYEDGGGYYVTQ